MLRLAHVEGRADQDARLVARAPRDHFGTERVGSEQAVRPVLLGRADGNDQRLGGGEIGLDLGPSGEVELHECLFSKKHCHPRPSDAQASRGEGDPGRETIDSAETTKQGPDALLNRRSDSAPNHKATQITADANMY